MNIKRHIKSWTPLKATMPLKVCFHVFNEKTQKAFYLATKKSCNLIVRIVPFFFSILSCFFLVFVMNPVPQSHRDQGFNYLQLFHMTIITICVFKCLVFQFMFVRLSTLSPYWCAMDFNYAIGMFIVGIIFFSY